ncbi:MAG: endopeptidase La [Candidatus Omnitrophica bacterium]|nr:endopeptidase La [Candidatus Omnitrophota bacterium]
METKVKTDKRTYREILPLLPLRDVVVFPGIMVPLLVGRERSVLALDEAMSKDRMILLCAQKRMTIKDPESSDLYGVGTVAEVLQILKLPDGSTKILVEGFERVRIKKFISTKGFFKVEVERLAEKTDLSIGIKALMRSGADRFEEYARMNPKVSPEVLPLIAQGDDVEAFIDALCGNLIVKVSEKQHLLEIANPLQRLKELNHLLMIEIELLKVEKKIMGEVRNEIEKSQKDFYLQEQLKVIERELGRKDGHRSEADELREKISKAQMSKEAEAIANRELDKFVKMMPISPEATVIRNYIDWLVNLPWGVKTKDNLDIEHAHRVLEEDHYGLKKPKERILEYLAVKRLSKSMKGEILCLVGPPGVGKTSLARSIARAVGRNFVRISLGGIRDEAEIRGHRRTYIGAMPGRIIQSIKKAKSRNPVFLLDEVDKMSTDFRGDPSSALLEVLDTEQNHAFSDHYLEVDFDLSECLFICTSNIRENIPFPMQDRMEIIKLPGYTAEEKKKIATQFLIPKQINLNGLKKNTLEILTPALSDVIIKYTREAGVRELERRIAQICRKVAKEVVSKGRSYKVRVTSKNLAKFLGQPLYLESEVEKANEVGVTTGLAWTEAGGDIMAVETSMMNGKGKLILTGKLGEIMQESAKASLTYIRSRAKELNIDGRFYKNTDIHIHIPEGAIPKDGPSAGITMATALVSMLTGRPARYDVAMTGEITLRGRVLPVGGVKSKLLAAHRAGIKTVILPKKNEKDLDDIPKDIRKRLQLVFVEEMKEVLNIALVKPTKTKSRKRS